MSLIPTKFKETINAWVHFDDEELYEILGLFEKRTLKKGDKILKRGNISQQVIFIEKGILREFYLENGLVHNTWMLPEGYFTLSLGSFMDETPSRYAIECLEDCELYLLPKASQQALLENNPKALLFNNYLQMAYLRTYEHCMELLRTTDATTRYELFLEAEGGIASRVSQKHIASYLSMDATTLSKIRRNKRNKGL